MTHCYQLNWLQSMSLTTQHSMHLCMCASFVTLLDNVVHIMYPLVVMKQTKREMLRHKGTNWQKEKSNQIEHFKHFHKS